MKTSYNWLQEYFDNKLPTPAELAKTLTFYAYEVESVDEVGSDTILDIDVLPNRGHDSLSHRGVAREVATLTGLSMKESEYQLEKKPSESLQVSIADPKLCRRFSGVLVSGIAIADSPAWLKDRLEAIGQQSINNVVDATNYVMFALGQPMHSYDAGKLAGESGAIHLTVRPARAGEHFVSLDSKEYDLDEDRLTIANQEKDDTVVGLAGVKGGLSTAVDDGTTRILFEAANFDPVSVRKTARKFALLTDASKRFENERHPEFTWEALAMVLDILRETCPQIEIEATVDEYPTKLPPRQISISHQTVNRILGTNYSLQTIQETLDRLRFAYTQDDDIFTVDVPTERLDMVSTEDLLEEIGRVLGFVNIESKPFTDTLPVVYNPIQQNIFALKKFLVERGLSEVQTYSLVKKGDIRIANPLANDKGQLRKNLHKQVLQAMERNVHNAPLLGLTRLAIFEIGNVFTKDDGQILSLCIAVQDTKKQKGDKPTKFLEDLLADLDKRWPGLKDNLRYEHMGHTDAVIEVDLGKVLADISSTEDGYEDIGNIPTDFNYDVFSIFPFSWKDIAFWTPQGTSQESVRALIEQSAGDNLVRLDLFDVFSKEIDGEEMTSYAFRLVFQSPEKTLTDTEISQAMDNVTKALQNKGFSVR